MSLKRIAYFYSPASGNFHYGENHPMKPHRVTITHSLVFAYGLHEKMEVVPMQKATKEELLAYHSPEYIDFLRYTASEQYPCDRVTDDCPLFEGLPDYCSLYAGGSIEAARRLNSRQNDVCINWAGGLHHAKKADPSGFCYVNDIVLAIQELLRRHERVMYIDIDIHHGDGVEEAFYHTDRVLTLSFHKFGDNYFPGTGEIFCTGHGQGRGCAVNVPLKTGVDDASYHYVFKRVVDLCLDRFKPLAIVMQCGSDSLAGDRLGCFGLTIRGHGECLRYVSAKDIPLLVLGGGGYKVKSVSRCWAYETGLLCGEDLPNAIPENEYSDYFAPEYRLHCTEPCRYDNENTRAYLDTVLAIIENNLLASG